MMHQIECSQEELVNITPAMKHLLNLIHAQD